MDNMFIKVFLRFLVASILLLGGVYFVFNYSVKKPLITFVSTSNTGRSPMAESLIKRSIVFSTYYRANSRGVNMRESETKPEEKAVIVMQEKGLDISRHRAQQLTENDVKQAKFILTMTKAQKTKIQQSIAPAAGNVYMLSECADGTQMDIPNAYNQSLSFYRQVRDAIEYYLKKIDGREGLCYSVS